MSVDHSHLRQFAGVDSAERGFSIQPAREMDVPALLHLWEMMMREHEAFDPRIRLAESAAEAYRAYLSYHIGNAESHVGVARLAADSGIAGYALVSVNRNLPMFLPPRYGYLSDLVVAPDHRRRGIGRALVNDIRQFLLERNIESMQLQVYARNERAIQFWRALGFDPFYDRMWLDLQ